MYVCMCVYFICIYNQIEYTIYVLYLRSAWRNLTVCVCMYVCVCIYVFMYVCVCIYVCMYVCMYVCVYVRVQAALDNKANCPLQLDRRNVSLTGMEVYVYSSY
jgi:hypothetical protein